MAATQERKVQKHAPDGGYGWVIVIVSILLLFIAQSIFISFTMLYIEFSRVFGLPKGIIGWAQSIQTAISYFTGLFSSVFFQRYGGRPVAMVGSIITAAGFAASSQVTNIYQLYITHGLLTGIGVGNIMYTSLVVTHAWFNKRRPLAVGLAAIGFNLGNLLMTPITRALVEEFGWRGALLLISGMALHGLPLSMLLRPSPSQEPCTSSYRQMLVKLVDFTPLRYVPFLLYCVGVCLQHMGMIAFLQHIGSRSYHNGVSLHETSLILTIQAVFSFFGRIGFSFLANWHRISRVLLYAGSAFLGGIFMVTSTSGKTFVIIVLFATGYGLTMACYLTVQQTVIVDLLGVANVARGQGILTCFMGFATLISIPLAGFIFDLTQDYDMPYFIMGGVQLLGSVIIFLVYYTQKRTKPQHLDQTLDDTALAETKQSNITCDNDGDEKVESSLINHDKKPVLSQTDAFRERDEENVPEVNYTGYSLEEHAAAESLMAAFQSGILAEPDCSAEECDV